MSLPSRSTSNTSTSTASLLPSCLEVRATLELEQAESKKKILEQYVRGKTIKELMSEAIKASSEELAGQATWELEKGKRAAVEQDDKAT